MSNAPFNLTTPPTPIAAQTTDDLSASELLEHQATQTRAAMTDTITGLKYAAIRSLNPRPWFRHHPALCTGILLGGAAVIGAAIYRRTSPAKMGRKRKSRRRSSARLRSAEATEATKSSHWIRQLGAFLASDTGRSLSKTLINALIARIMARRMSEAMRAQPLADQVAPAAEAQGASG